MTSFLFVTVIIPCRDECAHIAVCLDSLVANDYPANYLEILVVDGMSEDGTREIVQNYMQRYSFINLLDNPKRITPAAMNIGIRTAKGEVIALVGAHSIYDRHYLSECVKHLAEYSADEVGAVAKYISRKNTLVGQGIVMALAHPFGAGANIRYKVGATRPTWVDTVSSGCYRRDVFDRIGLFNEELIHSQDIEFNLRLKRKGGRILLVPTAKIEYHARSDIKSFSRHNFRNGLWAILPFIYSDVIPISWRHLLPLVFVLGLVSSAMLALMWPLGLWVLLGIVGGYSFANLIASAHIASRERNARYLWVMSAIFADLHLLYGLGSIWGVIKVIAYIASGNGRIKLGTPSSLTRKT